MDENSFRQLKEALSLTPHNHSLLALVVTIHLQRHELAEALTLLAAVEAQDNESEELATAAARAYLAANDANRALHWLRGETPALLLLRARALLALERRKEGDEAYRKAIAANPTLEDPQLASALRANVVEFDAPRSNVKLRLISNDDTDRDDLDRLVEPRQPPLRFEDIGGLEEIKRTIHKKIILPYQKPGLFQRFKKRAGGGILLYGPPGCGKTLLARATAGECNAEFFNVAISDVLDMYIGESERKLHALFERAREAAPAVLFFDEVEALGGRRHNARDSSTAKLVSQFLSEMDGFAQNNHGVLILAATNVPWAVDSAFRRPGRFDRVLFVPPPDQVARRAILQRLLAERPAAGDIDIDHLAKRTSGFSGADLRELVESAADEAIEESLQAGSEQLISDRHLKQLLTTLKPTTLEWLTSARNYARYANEGGQYDEVLDFLKRFGKG